VGGNVGGLVPVEIDIYYAMAGITPKSPNVITSLEELINGGFRKPSILPGFTTRFLRLGI
jgi:hypothetical protein